MTIFSQLSYVFWLSIEQNLQMANALLKYPDEYSFVQQILLP